MRILTAIFIGVLLSWWSPADITRASSPLVLGQDSIKIRLDFLQSSAGSFPPPLEMGQRGPKIGLALSGGGARGLAQIGVLKVFEREKIPIDFIVGTSMGGVIGGLYAAGYSAAELERIALDVDWNDLLSDTPPRMSLFLSQREEKEGSLFQFRLDGIKPYVPTALTSGQKLTNLFADLTMRARLTSRWFSQPYSSFDNLTIPFRAVTTDLVTGERVILDSGDLAQALRATMTIPLAFSPVQQGDSLLVDGGLVDPIPVDIAKGMGSDLVVAVNTVSSLLPADKLKTPLDVANQATSIMSLRRQREALEQADLVIAPDLSGFSSMDFDQTEELIARGQAAAERVASDLNKRISHGQSHNPANDPTEYLIGKLYLTGNKHLKTDQILDLAKTSENSMVTAEQIRADLERIYASGYFSDVYASLENPDSGECSLGFHVSENPPLDTILFVGNSIYPDSLLFRRSGFSPSPVLNLRRLQQVEDSTVSLYHQDGYSLAHVAKMDYDSTAHSLTLIVDEGIVSRIDLSGNRRTRNWVVLRNLPQKVGKPFNARKINSGIANIYSTGLFEEVGFSTRPADQGVALELKVKEKKFSIVRMGAHYNDEYQTEGFLELVDANLFGIGNRITAHLQYGERKELYRLSFTADRIFKTYLTYKLDLYHALDDRRLFEHHRRMGQFCQKRLGASLSLGQHMARFGIISVEAKAERVKIEGDDYRDSYNLRSLMIRSLVDSFDRYPFPTQGKYHHLYVELAGDILGGDVVYRKAFTSLESYFPLNRRVNFHPKIAIGASDGTLPISEKFTLGGWDSLYGLFSEELVGDKVFVGSLGLRFRFFRRWYWTVRYDVGRVWSRLESIKFKNLKHGVGSSLALDTPLGPLEFAYGVATDEWDKFYFRFGYGF
jgi:NTE family protein